MRPFIATVVLVATVASAMLLPKRDKAIWQSPFSGTIVSPSAGSTIVPAVDFAFDYATSNWCESAFTPFTVYLTQGAEPPSFDNVTTDGTLADGSYLYNLGKFTVSNFGLPLSAGDAPPSTLNVPADVLQVLDGTQPYLSVVQEFDGCPGHITTEYSLTFVAITVNASTA
ncbi:hypothetical protein L226DRAFT_574470 [Lentinus tigrinus ALCF2SS1-7]|uniref:Secreted protein n=1 Tax=Lentinus tigrinus ALCF2SS1-6 TaxID=1328759 RepID=A0A5C2S6I7_9APHY|nr:hypothetical protein L227DRAFT_564169 [Lentinus tigrinus ALCF2SS1-6]RPD70811.1 hypothetical protein L226DRAFT_574470 [Lentinus tigrinus ALCF2SS1-7]